MKQGYPLSPHLFIIVLELMAVEMGDEKEMKGITLNERDQNITSVSNKINQKDNRDDRLSMFADDSSTIVVDVKQVRVVKECIYNYEKASTSKLHEGKTKVMKLGKARRRNITKTHMNTNFTIMEDTETEKYLGDIVGNIVTEEETYEKAIRGIEILGAKWLKEHMGVQGRTIVTNTLLQPKLAHRASVKGASKKCRTL